MGAKKRKSSSVSGEIKVEPQEQENFSPDAKKPNTDISEKDEDTKQLTDQIIPGTVPEILSEYGATLLVQDQRLLSALTKFDVEGKTALASFYPLMWGPAAKECYDNLAKLGPALWNRPSENQVLHLIDKQKMWLSALKIPLDITTDPTNQVQPRDLYNPRFCLSLFAGITASNAPISSRVFIESNALALVFASLSCSDGVIRAQGYLVLLQLLNHLKSRHASSEEDSEFPQRALFLYLITILKNSLERENQRIPCIISHFLIRVTRLLMSAEDPLFPPLTRFLLLKPTLDMQYVPEFYTLFNSTSLEHFKRERHWLLYLLADGVREARDYRILEKRYGMKLLLSFYNSPLADDKSKELILRIVTNVLRISSCAVDLYRKHNLIGWIVGCLVAHPAEDTAHSLVECLLLVCGRLTDSVDEISGTLVANAKVALLFAATTLTVDSTLKVRVNDELKKLEKLC